MAKTQHRPDDIVMARRKAGYGAVSTDMSALMTRYPDWQMGKDILAGKRSALVEEGDVIPMRYQEAVEREDFEPVDDDPKSEPKLDA